MPHNLIFPLNTIRVIKSRMSLAGYAAGVEGMELHTQIKGNPERNTACGHQGLRGEIQLGLK